MKHNYKFLTLALAGLSLFSGCGDDDSPQAPEVKSIVGETQTVGTNGTIQTVARTTDGSVDQVAITLDENAFVAITSDTVMSMNMLDLPAEVQAQTGLKMVTIDWNPAGHDPAPIYSAPHFDFHFFTRDHSQVMTIPGGTDTVAVLPNYVPSGFAYGPPGSPAMSVPQMGVHYVDMAAPEFNGQPFTKTFIYGFSQGQHVFIEPMVTKAYLQSHPNSTSDIKQPVAFQVAGKRFPTKYTIKHDAATGKYHIMLEGFVQH